MRFSIHAVSMALVIVILCAVPAAALVPHRLAWQGVALDSTGFPVPDDVYTFTFNIYAVPSGGVSLWTEVLAAPSENGVLNVTLGSLVPIPDSVFNDTLRYLEITFENEPPYSPRSPIVSVGFAYRVGSVDGASGGTILSKVTIGPGNINAGTESFVAGANNRVYGNYSVVSGGGGSSLVDSNSVTGDWSTIGGGTRNRIETTFSTVGGGYSNLASGGVATIAGGQSNVASGAWSTVAGGTGNSASHTGATVGGGSYNSATDPASSVAGGEVNAATNPWATVSGGAFDTASGDASTVGGGYSNIAGNGYATVGGGRENTASGGNATVSGGEYNEASGIDATVGGGFADTASANNATVGGGYVNTASGDMATVPGGRLNTAAGARSFAAGNQAKALHFGTFVWGDNTLADFSSTADNQFLIRAAGGVGIGTNSPAALLHVNGTAGNNTGVWSNLSDRRLKQDIEPIQNALETVRSLQPVTFRWKDPQKDAQFGRVRGLIAQDVEQVIPEWVKTDPEGHKRLEPIGVDALLIGAMQELYAKAQEIEQLKASLSQLEQSHRAFLDALQARLTALETRGEPVSSQGSTPETRHTESTLPAAAAENGGGR